MKAAGGFNVRPATLADLPTCEAIWRDGLNDYLQPLGQMEIPADNASLRQLHEHVLATDPALFRVAVRPDGRGNDVIEGFVAAARRGDVWFLSMLFVRPGTQLGGIGRGLLAEVMPTGDEVIAVATDAAQPISNGLYAAVGMPSRLPAFNVVGRPTRADALLPLPPGITGRRVPDPEDADTAARGGAGVEEVADVDREVLGYDHPEDHAHLRRQSRIRFDYRDSAGRLAGYGYTSEAGRIGPVAARDAALLAPIVADLLVALPPRGASALWVTGDAGPTLTMLVRAGLRIEGFPVLLGWSRPFADFTRYGIGSPGLL